MSFNITWKIPGPIDAFGLFMQTKLDTQDQLYTKGWIAISNLASSLPYIGALTGVVRMAQASVALIGACRQPVENERDRAYRVTCLARGAFESFAGSYRILLIAPDILACCWHTYRDIDIVRLPYLFDELPD